VLNDAVSIYLPDATLAGGFIARWCIGHKVEAAECAFRVREDEPAQDQSTAAPDAVTPSEFSLAQPADVVLYHRRGMLFG
jgi:hypothetical protein